MTTTTQGRPVTHYGVVFGLDEADRQVYTDYGDSSYISTHAEQMATREFFRLSALGVRCGFWTGATLTAGEDMIFVDEPDEEDVPAVEHKTRTFCPMPETGQFDKRGRPMHDRSACAICTCGWTQWQDSRALARTAARDHRNA